MSSHGSAFADPARDYLPAVDGFASPLKPGLAAFARLSRVLFQSHMTPAIMFRPALQYNNMDGFGNHLLLLKAVSSYVASRPAFQSSPKSVVDVPPRCLFVC